MPFRPERAAREHTAPPRFAYVLERLNAAPRAPRAGFAATVAVLVAIALFAFV